MAKQILALEVKKRDKKAKPGVLRREGMVPGVVYGHGLETVEVLAPYAQFVKIYKEAGESSLVDLNLAGEGTFKVLFHEVDLDPLTDKIIHFDLYRVKMTEKLEATIKLKFIGLAPAVAEKGGVLVKNLDELEVRCLPGDLVSEIEVDLSGLKDFGNAIKVSDLKIPQGIEVLNDKGLNVVIATEPMEEEVAPSAAVEEKVEEVEVIKKEKKEEETAEETKKEKTKPEK